MKKLISIVLTIILVLGICLNTTGCRGNINTNQNSSLSSGLSLADSSENSQSDSSKNSQPESVENTVSDTDKKNNTSANNDQVIPLPNNFAAVKSVYPEKGDYVSADKIKSHTDKLGGFSQIQPETFYQLQAMPIGFIHRLIG